jgi:acetate kinase
MGVIITCNAGSTNTKLAAYDSATLERKAHLVAYANPEIEKWISAVGKAGIEAVGYRVVHGGREFTQPVLINDAVVEKLENYISLAPLHQPAALEIIGEVRGLYPAAAHIACFDTAFHSAVPEIERWLPLPRIFHDEGIVRYGFHGLSYQHVASVLPEYAGKKAGGRIIVAHLGGGSSACAMRGLKSVASTMGFSTLDGLMMGSRCGTLDPGVILHLLQEKQMPVEEVSDIFYHKSGLKGVSAISGDMRELLENNTSQAKEAVELYCYLAAKQLAGLLPALGGLDALVFTGGIGENASLVREKITGLLRFLGEFPVYVIPTDEEIVIATACAGIIKTGN